jgi:hypothetical protein
MLLNKYKGQRIRALGYCRASTGNKNKDYLNFKCGGQKMTGKIKKDQGLKLAELAKKADLRMLTINF